MTCVGYLEYKLAGAFLKLSNHLKFRGKTVGNLFDLRIKLNFKEKPSVHFGISKGSNARGVGHVQPAEISKTRESRLCHLPWLAVFDGQSAQTFSTHQADEC